LLKMFGISTAWKSEEIDNGEELLDRLLELEIQGIELEYRITPRMFHEMLPRLKKREVPVLSIHNFLPLPEIIPKEEASGDALRLSAEDKEERELAVKYTIRTIQNAHELEVPVVVLHLGKVEMDPETERLFELYDNREDNPSEWEEFVNRKLRERERKKTKFLDAVFFSLDKLLKEAEKLQVFLGVENRYHFHEVPDFEEIGKILKEFEGSNVRYWHDTGHAHACECLGGRLQREYLEAYAPMMIGIHLHDAKGYDDHYAPGQGEVDFDMVKSLLPERITRVIEVHPKVSRDDLLKGIDFLKQKGILP